MKIRMWFHRLFLRLPSTIYFRSYSWGSMPMRKRWWPFYKRTGAWDFYCRRWLLEDNEATAAYGGLEGSWQIVPDDKAHKVWVANRIINLHPWLRFRHAQDAQTKTYHLTRKTIPPSSS